MPMYDYVCGACGHEDTEYHRMGHVLSVCPKCQRPAYLKQVSLPHTDLKEFHTPIEMYSVAEEDLGKIRDLKRRCPDADISDDPANPLYGVPVARSRKAKLQVLKANGFQEINSERVRR